MRPSEIFDEFVKIAQEKGMLSNDSKKKLEENPRADSLSVKDIEKLYNVKPDVPKDMEYKSNIMEIAHKDPTVLSSSHDKLNGLVENNIERQNIIINILNKNKKRPTGQLNNPKYAQDELTLSLIRLGNSLDALDKDELTKLADIVLDQLTKKKDLNKQVRLPVSVIPIVATVAVVLGALYIQQHTDYYNQGFEYNYKRLMNELNDFLTSSSGWGITGYDYKSSFIKLVKDLQSQMNGFRSTVNDAMSTIKSIQTPKTGKELLEQTQEEGNDIKEAYDQLYEAFEEHYAYLDQVKRNFSSQVYKEEQIADKGILTDLIDRTQFLHGGKGLISDDFDDVVHALNPYIACIADPNTGYLKLLSDAKSVAEDAKNKLNRAGHEVAKAPKWKGTPTQQPPQQMQPQKNFKQFSAEAEDDEEDFKKMFGG